MSRVHGLLRFAVIVAVLLGLALIVYGYFRSRPQDLPWTKLDLSQPIGAFTGRKLAALADDPAQCKALLDRAGVTYAELPPQTSKTGPCGYRDGVRLASKGARRIGFSPDVPATACPVAAALAMWEWNVLQPAARRHFGVSVERIDHLGTYSCRRLYGRSSGDWSEHATADAIDVAGFTLSDGTRVSVLGDWGGDGEKAAFLREVRDGACRVFATVLSPDYNEAHRDHLHLDQADRGAAGWRACR